MVTVMSQQKVIMKPQSSPAKVKSQSDVKVKETFPTKVVVRRLPPTLTAESFLEEVSPLPEHNYFNFVPADRSLGQYALCRAVINFTNSDDLFIFREKFDNYVFVDSRGNEYPAVVEYAPFQKIPGSARKDYRENTLDDDADFKKFLENLENPETPPTLSIKEVMEELDAKVKERQAAQNSETPLLAFINRFKIEKKKAQEKLKEERRLREIERKKEERKRRERERERREAAEESKLKAQSAKPSSAGDRRVDTKKPGNKTDIKAFPSKSGAKAVAEPKSTASGNSKPPEKYVKPVSTSQKHSKDDIIVRTLSSNKSKSSKQVADKPRLVSAKTAPSQGKSSQPSQQKSAASASLKSVSAEDGARDTPSPQKVLSGKQEVSVRSASGRTSENSSRPQYDKTKESKVLSKKVNTDKMQQVTAASVEGLSDKARSLKLKERRKPEDNSDTSSSSDKASRLASDRTTERAASVDSNSTSDSKSTDNSEADLERPRSARNIRYKDRPERAIYNPAARAAERRQRQQAKTTNSDGKVDQQ